MAKPTTAPRQSAPGLVELYNEERDLKARLEKIQQDRKELTRQQSSKIREEVVDKLQIIARLISPLMEDENWSWRATGEFDGVLAELELQPKEAKPIELTEEFKELMVGFLRSQPHGASIDKLAEGIKNKEGKPVYGVPTLRQRLPKAVQEGVIKVRKDGRSNIYFVEAKAE